MDAAVFFENKGAGGDVVEKGAVVAYEQEGGGILQELFFEQFEGFGVEIDRLIVRDGGYNCCGSSIDKDTYIFTVTDSDELKNISDHIQFVPFTNTLTAGCMCCGYPGLDWYEGTKRVAITSLQHGQRIRWKDFGTSYFGPFRMYGDLPLTIESSIWITQWLRGHGVTKSSDLSEDRSSIPRR